MYYYPPVEYIEPLFRPPSEANSLILQVTNGCSWNKCTFCEMYTAPQKKFKPKAEEQVLAQIVRCGQQLAGVRRVFLADGDAMALSFRRLKTILEAIREHLPSVTRVSAYCLPRNLKNKTVEQLQELEALGLKLLYIGAESGDDGRHGAESGDPSTVDNGEGGGERSVPTSDDSASVSSAGGSNGSFDFDGSTDSGSSESETESEGKG